MGFGNLAIDHRFADDQCDRLRVLAAEPAPAKPILRSPSLAAAFDPAPAAGSTNVVDLSIASTAFRSRA